MINRKRLKCVSCGATTITRTGVGHGTVQKHKFSCPGCGVEIGYVLHLDQKAITLEYDKPSNAEWCDGEESGDHEVLFYPELMVPNDLLPSPMSPFVVTVWNHKNVEEYQQIEAARRHFKDSQWPALERSFTHLESGNVDLLRKDTEGLSQSPSNLSSAEDRAAWLMGVTRYFFDFFVINPDLKDTIGPSIAYAHRDHEQELRRFAGEYVRSGRMTALWKEVKSIRRQFMELYESLQPLLMVRRYWKDEFQDIADYGLAVKNFEDLKGFYIDCVETTFRLMTIGLGIELIATSGRPIINTKTGDRSIWWFEQMNNGIKDGQLNKYAIFAPLLSALDLGLRNGVGHHAAHYDVTSDEIVYVKGDDANLNEMRLPFTEFVDKVYNAYCAFELATEWFRWLLVAGGGRFL